MYLLRQKPSQWDSSLSLQLQQRQENRDYMDKMERAFQQTSIGNQRTIESLTGLIRLIAPMIPIKADTALVEFLEDVQTPGAPAKLSALELDKAIYSSDTPPRERADPFVMGGGTGDK